MMISEIFSWKKIGIILGLVFIASYPVVHGNTYIMHIFILFFIWALVASNWNLLMGYAGIFSLGNIGYLPLEAMRRAYYLRPSDGHRGSVSSWADYPAWRW